MIKGAIFDLDGTLLDTMGIWQHCGEAYLRSVGCEPGADVGERVKRMSVEQAARLFQREYGVALPEETIVSGVNAVVADYYIHTAPLKTGVAELLKSMKDRGVKLCVATATARPLTEAALTRCGIRQFFSRIFTCSEVGHGKDEPVIYREALNFLGTEKSETAVIEDAFHAVMTAKRDGFFTVAVCDPQEPKQLELQGAADLYLFDFSDVSAFWNGIEETNPCIFRQKMI